jgi:hypothetical protein
LYSSKIQFHQQKNFSSIERFGVEDKIALERIPQLKESLETISKIMKEVAQIDGEIELKSVVNINFLVK